MAGFRVARRVLGSDAQTLSLAALRRRKTLWEHGCGSRSRRCMERASMVTGVLASGAFTNRQNSGGRWEGGRPAGASGLLTTTAQRNEAVS
jgi:hypothetical protein